MILIVENNYIEVPKKFIEDSAFLSGVLECDEGANEIVVPGVSYKTMEDTVRLYNSIDKGIEKYLSELEHNRFVALLKCIDYLIITCLLDIVVNYISKKRE